MVIFAEATTWQDVVKYAIGLAFAALPSYLAYRASRDARLAQAEAAAGRRETGEVNTKVDTVNTKVDTAATAAAGARKLAKFAAQAAVVADKKADARSADLKEIKSLANGNLESLQAKYDALQAKYEAVALLVPPEKVAVVVEAVAKATGDSGTKLNSPRDPASRERRDDPPKDQ